MILGGNLHGGDTLARANYVVWAVPSTSTTAAKELDILLEDAWVHEGDRDGDGLWDDYELANALDPDVADSDGDGAPDEHELTSTGKTHWEAQEASTPSGGGDESSSNCGLLGFEILLLLALQSARRS